MKGIYLGTEGFKLYLEYADNGDLFDKISSKDGVERDQAKMFFRQLICGLEYIHSKNIVHRDIKPENLLITKSNILKISDFGMSATYRRYEKEVMLNGRAGTLQYAAPEILAQQPYRGPPADIWSSGMVLVVMLTKNNPWKGGASQHIKAYVQWISGNVNMAPWNHMEVPALELVKTLLTKKVESRATIQQIKKNSWFKEDLRVLKRAREIDENNENRNENAQLYNTTNGKRLCSDDTKHQTPSKKTDSIEMLWEKIRNKVTDPSAQMQGS